MIVTCPACSTRYLVDPRALGSAGRTVRCANCSNTWHQVPPEDFPRPLELLPDEVEPSLGPPRYPVPAPPRRARSWPALSWVVLALALLAVVVVGVMARVQVTALWPPAARLYQLAGLRVTPPGPAFEFRNVTPRRSVENGAPVLIIEGEVVNISKVARDVPTLNVVLHDRDGKEVQRWDFTVTEPHLAPDASATFRTSVENPNPAATGVVVVIPDNG